MRKAILLVLSFFVINVSAKTIHVQTVVGPATITDPLAIALIESPIMQRLKHIDQHGPPTHFLQTPTFSRFDHCVGVYVLLNKMGVSRAEQIAGLLHDASHTVYSHTADHLFPNPNRKDAYQDEIHEWFLYQMEVDKILNQYGMRVAEALAKQDHYTALEQDLPNMCADRIEYNLHTGIVMKRITWEEAAAIVEDLHFVEGQWYFTNMCLARKFAELSLFFTEHFWAPPWNIIMNKWLSKLLKRAMLLGVVTHDDIHFGTDHEVLAKLQETTDDAIKNYLRYLNNPFPYFHTVNATEDHDIFYTSKFRGIDPLVQQNGKLLRLTALDPDFRKKYVHLKEKMSQGFHIRLREN